MSLASAVSGGEVQSTRHKIGQTDWNDPDSVALCAAALWAGRTNYAKARAEAQAYRNLAYVAGDQWWAWSERFRRMVDTERDLTEQWAKPKWQRRLTYNQIIPAMEMLISKLVRNNPAWDVVPATEDDNDVAKGRASADVMKGMWQEVLHMDNLVARAVWWARTTKTCFLDVQWDANSGTDKVVTLDTYYQHPDIQNMPLGGEVNPTDMARQMMAADYGQEAAKAGQWKGKTGNPSVDLAPLFEVNGWPFNAVEFDQWTIWQRTYEQTAEQVAESLNLDIDYIRTLARPKDSDEFYRRKQSRSAWQERDYGDWGGSSGGDEDNDSILVHKIMRVPCKAWPSGRIAYVIGTDCVVGPTDNPYRCGHQTLVPLQDKQIPNFLWGRCMVDDLIDPQRDLNLSASQKSNHRNFALAPTIIKYKGSQVPDSDFSNAPGGIIEVNRPDLAPTILEHPPISSEYDDDINRNLQMIREISGVGQVDYGGTTGGNPKSGRGVLALQEQNDARQTLFGEQLNQAIAQCGIRVLDMLQDFASDEQILQLVGENNRLEVVKFRGHDLRPSNYDQPGARTSMVRVQSFSQLPSTRAELRMLLDALTSNGVLDPINRPDDRITILEMYGIGDKAKLIDRTRKHRAKQMTEIDRWKQGQSVAPPTQTDNHAVHRIDLEDWMNTQSYQDTIMSYPPLAQEIKMHLDMHYQGEADATLRPQFYLQQAQIRLAAEFQAKNMQAGAPGIGRAAFPPLGGVAPPPATGPNSAPPSGNGRPAPRQALGQQSPPRQPIDTGGDHAML